MFRAPRPSTLRPAALLLALSLALPAAAHAQQPRGLWYRQVGQLLDQNTTLLSWLGERRSHDDFIDQLDSGAFQTVRLTLRAGQSYTLAGVCDEDCGDLDFHLYDNQYNLVASDTAPDNTPVVTVTPQRTGTYHLRVTMAACSVNPCWWGVGVYHR